MTPPAPPEDALMPPDNKPDNDTKPPSGGPLAQFSEEDVLSRLMSLHSVVGAPLSTRCTICKSPHKSEAEDIYDKTGSIVEVKKFLDARGEVLHVSNVKNHLIQHHRGKEAVAYMLEYADNVRSKMQVRRTQAEEADLACAISLIELNRVISLQTNGGDIGREKERNEMYVRAMREYRSNMEHRKTLNDEEARVRIIKEKVLQVWVTQRDAAKSPEQKEMLREMLKNFKAIYDTL